jgi:recombination protein RecT
MEQTNAQKQEKGLFVHHKKTCNNCNDLLQLERLIINIKFMPNQTNPDYPLSPPDEKKPEKKAPVSKTSKVKKVQVKTRAVSKPTVNKTPDVVQPVSRQKTLVNALNQRKNALKNFLGNEQNALRFMSSVMHSIQKTPKLLQCSPDSLLGAFMECAAIGLYPSNYSGDCYVLPYRKKDGSFEAQFQIGYKGIKTLAYRSGINRCGAQIVFSNDDFKQILGTSPRIDHFPAKEDRGVAVGAYAWAEVNNGSVVFQYMTEDEIMEIKKMSPASRSKYSPWNTNDPQKWMWKKTAFKQAGKMMPTSDKLNRAIYLDNVSERGGYIKSESEVVEVPFDNDPETKAEKGNAKKEALRKSKKQ